MSERVLSLPAVQEATSLGRSSIYDSVSAGTFPRPIQLTTRRVGWIASEIDAWLAIRLAERDEDTRKGWSKNEGEMRNHRADK